MNNKHFEEVWSQQLVVLYQKSIRIRSGKNLILLSRFDRILTFMISTINCTRSEGVGVPFPRDGNPFQVLRNPEPGWVPGSWKWEPEPDTPNQILSKVIVLGNRNFAVRTLAEGFQRLRVKGAVRVRGERTGVGEGEGCV